MAASTSNAMQTVGVVGAFVSELFESWGCGLQPKKIEVRHDSDRFVDVANITFDDFSVRVDIPVTYSSVNAQLAFECFTHSFLRARTYFSQDTLDHLNFRSCFHAVAVVGGYSHGSIIRVNISNSELRVAVGVPNPSRLSEVGGTPHNQSVSTVLYELATFSGVGVPAYVLHPAGEVPSEDFIHMTFNEFPLLGLLPASQGLIYTPTAFIGADDMYRPLRWDVGSW